MGSFAAIDHPRFRRVQIEIFQRRVVADCMGHACSLVKLGRREKLDACCQYGVNVDLGEKQGILAHREEIHGLLDDEVREGAWFREDIKEDPDFPSGRYDRTVTHDGGCIFLAHDRRGCAIHRASLEGGWDFHGIKPHVCRLFPVTYDDVSILISDDYEDYSCAYDDDAPTLYEISRDDLAAIFDDALVHALDAVAARVAATGHPDRPRMRADS